MPGRSSHSDESDDQTQGPNGAPQILSFLYQRDGLDRVFGHRFPQGLRPFPEGLSNSLEDVSALAAPQHDPSPSSSSDTTRVGRESSASTAKDARNTLGAEMNIASSGNGPGIADDPDSSTIPSSSIGPLLAYPTTVGAEQTGSPPEVNNGPVSISKVEARDGRVSADSPGSTGDETPSHIPVGTNAGAIDTSETSFDISIATGLGYNPEDAEFDFGQMDCQAPIANGNAEATAGSHRPAFSGDHSSAMSRSKDPVELEEHRYNEMDCQTGCLAQPIMQTVPALRGLTLETRMAIWECFYAIPRAHGIVCFFCGQYPLGWTTWIRGSAYYYAEPKDLRKMIQSAQEETFRVDHDIDAESRWVAHKKRPILLHMPPAYREAPTGMPWGPLLRPVIDCFDTTRPLGLQCRTGYGRVNFFDTFRCIEPCVIHTFPFCAAADVLWNSGWSSQIRHLALPYSCLHKPTNGLSHCLAHLPSLQTVTFEPDFWTHPRDCSTSEGLANSALASKLMIRLQEHLSQCTPLRTVWVDTWYDLKQRPRLVLPTDGGLEASFEKALWEALQWRSPRVEMWLQTVLDSSK